MDCEARKLFGKRAKKTAVRQKQLAIVYKMKEASGKFDIICAVKKEATHSLVEENKKRRNENYAMCRDTDTFYRQCNLVGGGGNVNDLAIRLSSVRGGNANDKADVGNRGKY